MRVTIEPEELKLILNYIKTHGLENIDRIEVSDTEVSVFLRKDKKQ